MVLKLDYTRSTCAGGRLEVLNGHRKCVFGRYVSVRVLQWSGKHVRSIGNSILHISYAAGIFSTPFELGEPSFLILGEGLVRIHWYLMV